MSENLVEYTEQELLTRYIIRIEQQRIRDSKQVIFNWQKDCEHRHVAVSHRKYEGYGERTEYFSDIRCLVCGHAWTEEGSK